MYITITYGTVMIVIMIIIVFNACNLRSNLFDLEVIWHSIDVLSFADNIDLTSMGVQRGSKGGWGAFVSPWILGIFN